MLWSLKHNSFNVTSGTEETVHCYLVCFCKGHFYKNHFILINYIVLLGGNDAVRHTCTHVLPYVIDNALKK
jgi:hypothetical protein